MNDFGACIQEELLRALVASAHRPADTFLADLRPALFALRQAYRARVPPAFGDAKARAAYALAYYPLHATAAAVAFGATGRAMLGLGEKANIVVLGAGPGPEVIGLVQAMRDCLCDMSLTFHLVDREAGWRETREATIHGALGTLLPAHGPMHWYEHELDLASAAGLAKVKPLVAEADLVLCQTVLTELPNPGGEGQLIERLGEWLGPEGRLLVIDVDRHDDHVGTCRSRLAARGDLMLRLKSTQRFPAPAPITPLVRHLFSPTENGLIARKGVNLDLFLYSRPGATHRCLDDPSGFELNAQQQDALARISRFFRDDGQIFTLTGAAGTGKTALLRRVATLAHDTGLPVQLMAPTGQAARRLSQVAGLGASTIHAAIYTFERTEFSLQEVAKEGAAGEDAETPPFELEQQTAPTEKGSDQPPVAVFKPRDPAVDPAIYLVDEASLIGNRALPDKDAEVLFAEGQLLADLVGYALDADASKLVLVGDKEQLPPVGEKEPVALLPEQLAAFTSHETGSASLTEIMRQGDDTRLLELATRARNATINSGIDLTGLDAEAGVNLLADANPAPWLFEACVRGEAIVVATRNQDAGDWNRKIRSAVGRPEDRPVAGDRLNLVRSNGLFDLLNGDEIEVADTSHQTETITLKGDSLTLREVQLRYEQPGVGPILFSALLVDELLLHAGQRMQSKVTQILFVDFIRRTGLKPPRKDADARERMKFAEAYRNDPKVNALRVNYGYARTCHRAQGGEWPYVLVDFRGHRSLGPDFGRWAYTAVTRAKRGVWLANLPRVSAPLDAAALSDHAVRQLADSGFVVEARHPIQGGVQLTIAKDGERGRFNLFQKKGRPSSLVPTGSERPSFIPSVSAIFAAWIQREASEGLAGLPLALEGHAATAQQELQRQGYALKYRLKADYQVEYRISGHERSALAIFYFKADGQLGKEQRNEGDLVALTCLKQALGR